LIENVIFDLGNVLINFRPRKLLSRHTSNMKRINEFLQNVIGSETWLELDRGTITFEDAKKIFLKNYPEGKDLIVFFYNNWKELFVPIQNSVEILRKLKKNGYRTFALSNFPEVPFKFVFNSAKFDFLKEFDGLVISYNEKIIKPEKEIYEILLQRYDLDPEKSLFIDDTKNFCLGAKKSGINTILFDINMNLAKELQKFDIII